MKKIVLKILGGIVVVIVVSISMLIYLGSQSIKESPVRRDRILNLPKCVLNVLETENGLVTENAINVANKKCEKIIKK